MTRRQALLLRVFSLWTAYIWLALVWNIWHDHTKGQTGIGFKGVHFVLAAISLTLAVTSWRVVTKVAGRRAVFPRRTATTGPTAGPTAEPAPPSRATPATPPTRATPGTPATPPTSETEAAARTRDEAQLPR